MPQKELLKSLLEITSPKAQITDFVEAFKFAVGTLNKMKAATGAELSQLRITFDQAVKDLQAAHFNDLEDTKTQLTARIDQALKEQEKGLNFLRDKVRTLQHGEDGEDGKDADEQAIITAVLAKIPTVVPDSYDDAELQSRIDAHAEEIKKLKESGGKNIPGWGAHPIQIFNSSGTVIDTVARNIKFGANLTTTRSSDGVITVTASGGSGFTALAATETPNGSRTTFTFAGASAQPSYLVVDNVWLKAISAAGNTNWSWNNGTKVATVTIPPNDDVWGVQ